MPPVPVGGVAGWVRRHPLVVDAALSAPSAAVLGVVSAELTGLGWTGAVSAAMVGALALRRVAPVVCTGAVCALALAHFLAGAEIVLGDVAVLVALYSVAVHGPPWANRLALALTTAGAVLQGAALVSGRLASGEPLVPALTASAAVPVEIVAALLVVWLAGQWRRTRTAYAAAVVDRARRLELQRQQEGALVLERARDEVVRSAKQKAVLADAIGQAMAGRA